MSAVKRPIPYQRRLETVQKGFRLRKQRPDVAEAIQKEAKVGAVLGRVLAARGFAPGPELERYLQPTLKDGVPAPKGLKNLDRACALIRETIEQDQGIAICCDFDVDGLSGGAQLYHFLSSIGVRTRVNVPDRFREGYGLNEEMIDRIADEGFALIVTIDFGTTNERELLRARERGLKTIVVDHHHVAGKPPPCDVFINPNQRGCGFADGILCAAGLAWYLVAGLKAVLSQASHIEVKSYLDLACLGTICDMVPLRGANRVIAKRGLELLGQTGRAGLKSLKNVVGVRGEVSCTDVSFGIGPRLNAAGRMVHGEVVIDLLTTADSTTAQALAESLNRLNARRQEEENRVKDVAVEKVKSLAALPNGIVVWQADFHTGVIGIVAQRLVELFYRPTVVLGADSEGVYKGSVRGIKGFNVVESLAAVSKFLVKFGGHEGAGGLSVREEHLSEFAAAFDAECERRIATIEREPIVEADTEVTLDEVNLELIGEFRQLAPFGMGNPNPQLLLRSLTVKSIRDLKGMHLKVVFSDGVRNISGLMWRQSSHPALVVNSVVDIVFRPEVNSYQGNQELYANLQAVQAAKEKTTKSS